MQAEKIDVVLYDTKNFHDMSHYEYNKQYTMEIALYSFLPAGS